VTATSDALIQRGLLDSPPGSVPTETFLATLATTVLDEPPLRGAGLFRIDSRGRLAAVGSFGNLADQPAPFDGHLATTIPLIISALRDGHHQEQSPHLPDQTQWESGVWVTAVGLRRPGMGVLLLTGTEQLRLTAEAWTLLRTWAELWLGRGSQWGGPASGPQVDASTSSVVFTDRQLEVLGLLANGLTNSEIGKELSISASLAKQEVAFLSHALQAKNRLDTVVQAQRQGILPVGRG